MPLLHVKCTGAYRYLTVLVAQSCNIQIGTWHVALVCNDEGWKAHVHKGANEPLHVILFPEMQVRWLLDTELVKHQLHQ
jgi:hypothetical protein